ncbi:MAG: DUF3307 domain-containing protein [candidate division KSB1 bacterium]|nr:DUF3307 domain-containing protein [candidate division KSB1 bacterium]MDZ7318381.1 DUF3307 domain-containing protein [candidate division KSB1 bacterium]MDZ7341006.1 DUF3307 domain-containing protein [candidate division KSB1 bacterium]
MNLIWLLVLAHFVADFPLQSDKIFALKSKYKWGLLPHVFISFLASLIVAFPYVQSIHFWYVISFLAVIHLLLDWLKLLATQKLTGDSLVIFLLDQFLHLFFIWLACAHIFYVPPPQVDNHPLLMLYLENKVSIILSGLIFAVFGGSVLLHYIEGIVLRLANDSNQQINRPFKFKMRDWGYLERLLVTLGIILGGWFLMLIPLALIPRLLLLKSANDRLPLMINLAAGAMVSIGTGLLVNFIS